MSTIVAGRVPTTLLLLLLLSSVVFVLIGAGGTAAASVTELEAVELRDEVRKMFYHGFDNYMEHAFPLDELKPLSCSGENSLGEYTLTLVDSLDTLALLGDRVRFAEAVRWLGGNLRFDRNKTVSLFETTIRVLGGLLSAHLIAADDATGMKVDGYENELLGLAEDLGRRLLPAFETPTGIPYGSVNLLYGVSEDESQMSSTACGGTLSLEFGILSQLTGDPVFETVARNAVRGLWARRSPLGLVGAHIDVFSGEWTHKDAGIGTSIDSFYEYLLKSYILFGDEENLYMFKEAYKAVMQYLYNDPWYLEVNMNTAVIVWPVFNSLQAFWPGLQVLAGDIEPAVRTHRAFFSVWKKYGFTPEGFNLATASVQAGQKGYPLRPELIESTYFLYKATRDPMYLDAGRDMLASLQSAARCPCGYCHIEDVESHVQSDRMESYFLAETVKYLYLLFDLGAGGENIVEKGPHKYIFSTEGHLFPITAEFPLPAEHCSYVGSFCNRSTKGEVAQLSQSKDKQDLEFGRGFDYLLKSLFNCSDGTCSVTDLHCLPESDETDKPIQGTCQKLSFWRQLAVHPPAEQVATVMADGDQQIKPLGPQILAKSVIDGQQMRQIRITISPKHSEDKLVMVDSHSETAVTAVE